MERTLLVPDTLLLPEGAACGLGLLVEGDRIAAIAAPHELAERADRVVPLEGRTLAPGLVDLQVNGGGGALLNDEPSVETIRRIACAHAVRGTTTLLPTLITSPRADWSAALEAARAACEAGTPGVAGLHLEGPFLDAAKRGAHPSEHLRAPDADDLASLQAPFPGRLLLTLSARHAVEQLTIPLRLAGVLLSLGHTDATAEEAKRAFDHGVSLTTHLYNAMSPLAHRAPGVVGAALADERVTACVIADGHHVHPTALRAAWEAKSPDHFLCVSDAISLAGSDHQEAVLGGQRVHLDGGRCLNEEGNLAGSAIVLADSLPVLVNHVGLTLAQAVHACATVPARVLGLQDRGVLSPNLRADMLTLDADLVVREVWQGGQALSA